jgi:RNA polymerase sigma-70 factor, ECF subfamily
MQSSGDLTFESLVKRYRQQLTGAAYHLCGSSDAAQDVVQDTLLDAYTGFAGLREFDKAGAWLYSILRRKAIAYRRTRRPEVELTEECMAPQASGAESLVRGIVVEQMSKLSDEDREILAGKYLLGLSYKELAESLGIKEGAVRVRALRAKVRLGEILKGAGVEVPRKR